MSGWAELPRVIEHCVSNASDDDKNSAHEDHKNACNTTTLAVLLQLALFANLS